ncbi:hypothetical protein C8J56DRAFT_1173170 [Mycena floridula]|nr:hypothetical protein C8J56DRAFT_1173170 [Mycena floridula]
MSVLLDDTDPSIEYSGDWITEGVSLEYNSTTHGAASSQAHARFNFSGTYIKIYGTIGITAGTGNVDPKSTYSVDNGPVFTFAPNTTFATDGTRRSLFFQLESIPDGEHTLVMRSIVNNSFMWFDYAEFTPSQRIVQGTTTGARSSTSTNTATLTGASNPTSTNAAALTESTRASLPVNALIGAAIGLFFATCLFCGAIFYCYIRRQNKSRGNVSPFSLAVYSLPNGVTSESSPMRDEGLSPLTLGHPTRQNNNMSRKRLQPPPYEV